MLRAMARHIARPRVRCFGMGKRFLRGKVGLEIGGPSSIFARHGLFPIYPLISRLDNCNFSHATIWEGNLTAGPTFRYDKKHAPGHQYILEATALEPIKSESYDFVLSSHTLEHIANPLRALSEWKRVLKGNGILVLVVPHRDGTFDHRRPVTPLGHLIQDFEGDTTEDDLTHLPEILALHDLSLDPEAGALETFKERSARNSENRCLHHHVFDTRSTARLIDHMALKIHAVEAAPPFHIFVIAEKQEEASLPDNHTFLSDQAEYYRRSPFASDRAPIIYPAARHSRA